MKKIITSSETNRQDRRIRHPAHTSERSVSRALDPGELLDGREERIRELKRQLDAGIYSIDSYKIAARMLARAGDGRNICPPIRC